MSSHSFSAAAIWSEVLNKQVRYADLPVEAFEEQLRQIFPAWLAKDLRLMFQGYEDRGFAPSNADVATLTSLIGHAPGGTRILCVRRLQSGANDQRRLVASS